MNHDADPYPNHAPMMGFMLDDSPGRGSKKPQKKVMIPELSNHYDDRRVVTNLGRKKIGRKVGIFLADHPYIESLNIGYEPTDGTFKRQCERKTHPKIQKRTNPAAMPSGIHESFVKVWFVDDRGPRMSDSQKFGMCERHGFDEPHALWLFVNGQNHVYEDSAEPAMINSLAIDLQFLTSCRYHYLDVGPTVYSTPSGPIIAQRGGWVLYVA